MLNNSGGTTVTASSGDKTNKLVGTVPPLDKGVPTVVKVVTATGGETPSK